MNKDKKLYKIKNKLGTFNIVACTFDEAANELKARLDQADYGFFQYRDIPAIEHVATQSFYNNELKQSFSDSKPNLIISGSDPICQREFAEQMALKCEECEKLKHTYDRTAADLADANEQLLKMQAEAEKKQLYAIDPDELHIIKRLRSLTGAGIADTRKALHDNDYDFDKALARLKELVRKPAVLTNVKL